MRFPTLPAIASAIALLATSAAVAQGTDPLLTTVGTTVEEVGKHHAYILWQPGEAGTTFGKRFSINRKNGPADSPSPFTRVGIQTLQTSPNTIRAMLEVAAVIDLSHKSLPRRIDGLYRESTYRGGEPPADPAVPNLDAAAKLAYLMAGAATDPATLSRLFFLGRAHPGVMMSLGHAYQIPVDPGVHTFEIREIDLADGDIRVVGRVTVDTANPVLLAAPASPVRVLHSVDPDSGHTVSPKDHLNARFRWGVPGTLRERLPHTFGFDLFRVRKDVAEDLGWDLTPPSPELMMEAVRKAEPTDANPQISRVNDLPILVSDLLTPAEAGVPGVPTEPGYSDRIDYADDGIWHRGANGEPVRREYVDGEAFYFFVAARAITGRPGELSPGTLAVMCRRMPPLPPVVEAVNAEFVAPANAVQWEAEGQGGTQFLQVKIRQGNEAKGYHIYRWTNPSDYLNNLGNPEIGRIGYVEHLPGERFVTFDDNGAGAPTPETHEDVSVWYTTRAVGISECPVDVLSGHSGPVPGFMRDFRAPDAPTGDFLICRDLPFASFIRREIGDPEKDGLPRGYRGISVEARRLSSRIVATDILVQLRLPDNSFQTLHSRRHMFRHGNVLRVNLPYPEPDSKASGEMRISTRAVTAHGLISAAAVAVVDSQQKPADYAVYPFQLNTERQCRNITEVPDPRPVHEAFDADGSRNAITGVIAFLPDQGTREWRIYRRVGTDGPLTLVVKNEGPALISPAAWIDDALPAASGARVCYYAQVFDQNANPSPLYPIGCVEMLNPDLPTPMLAPATITGFDAAGRMQVRLDWFSDPVGVERFEILIARDGGEIPDPQGISALLASEAVAVDAEEFEEQDFFRFQSARVSGPLIGSGPEFSASFTLPADGVYHFSIAAAGPGEFGARASGSVSNVVSAAWREEPDGPQPVIPWPARDLPGSFDARQPIEAYTSREGPFWPVALPNDFGKPTSILVGVTRHPLISNKLDNFASLASPEPPDEYLFRVRRNRRAASTLGELMPFMLFRYQLPSDIYPDARANIVQCTPMIDRMAWRFVRDEKTGNAYEIRDPYFHFFESRGQTPFNLPVSGGWTDENPPLLGPPLAADPAPPYLEAATGFIFLNDLLPVAQGAKYRHLIVQFDRRGELRRVIPIEPIQH